MKSTDQPLVIAVTGLNAIDSPGPGVAVIRALREGMNRPLRIIGLAYENLEPGIYMDGLCDKVYQISYPAAGPETLFQVIRQIHEKENLQIIIPNFDAELPNFIQIADRMLQLGIQHVLPDKQMFEARDKQRLAGFAQEHGFLAPRDQLIYRSDELLPLGEWLGYPLVVKGKFYEAQIAYSVEQAIKAFDQISYKWGLPIIVQQYIKGQEYNIAALGDGTGKTISAVPMRKVYITDKGKAWAGIILDEPEMIRLAEKFIKATNWRGGFELEIMQNDKGEYYIMEINPRFPAWIYVSAAVGQNQPAALARLALGEQVSPFKALDAGKMFIRYSWDMVIDIERFQQFTAFGNISNEHTS